MARRLVWFVVAGVLAAGCNVIPPALPNQVPGLTLGTIQQIQNDATLDATEKQQIIRAMLGLQDDTEGNRIVAFVLALTVP